MKFEELNLTMQEGTLDCRISEDMTIPVRTYLPMQEKADLISYVVDCAIDENTGCFSPVRLNVYFAIGIMKWYADIEFESLDDASRIFDLLESNGVVDRVLAIIPEEEREFIQRLVDDTVDDIARYNSSFAGVVHGMTGDANTLDKSLEEILEKIKNKEGLEVLSEIKNVVGTD